MPGLSDTVGPELAAELLRRGEAVEIGVGGASMWPLLRHGDRVRIEPNQRLFVGAIAAAWRDGHLVVHRIAGLDRDVVRLRGDHLDREDAPFARGEILGVVTRQRTRGLPEIDHTARTIAFVDRLAARVRVRSALPWRLADRLRLALRR